MWTWPYWSSGGTPTPTPTPTASNVNFDSAQSGGASSNFGLSRVDVTAGGSPSAFGTPQSLGTLTADIDGLEISIFSNTGITGAFNLYADGIKIVTAWGFNNTGSLVSLVDVPIRIASGKNITIEIAAVSTGNGAQISAKAYQKDVAETITSWAALGSTAGMQSQGVILAGGVPGSNDLNTWKTIGTLAAAAKAFAFFVSYGNDTTRTGSNEYNVDIGQGASGSETILLPRIKAKDNTNSLWSPPPTTRRMSVASGTRIAARGTSVAGTLPDNLAVQAMVGY